MIYNLKQLLLPKTFLRYLLVITSFISFSIIILIISIPEKQITPMLNIGNDVLVFDGKAPGETVPSIYLTSGKGTLFVRLTDQTSSNRVPEISPNGEKIVFVSTRDGNEEIYLMDIDGSNIQRLTNHLAKDSYPRFSPDGKHIVFFSNRSGNSHIYQLKITPPSPPKQLTSGSGNNYDPVFSPDGKSIYFTSDQSGSMNIYRFDLATEKIANLTNSINDSIHSSISSDGQSIIFRSNYSGSFEIHLMNLTTKKSHQISLKEGSKRHPSFSPDNKYAVYQNVLRNGKAEILASPIYGGNEMRLNSPSGANLNPSWGKGRGKIIVEENGVNLSCVSPLYAFMDTFKHGLKPMKSFLTSFTMFRPVCRLPSHTKS